MTEKPVNAGPKKVTALSTKPVKEKKPPVAKPPHARKFFAQEKGKKVLKEKSSPVTNIVVLDKTKVEKPIFKVAAKQPNAKKPQQQAGTKEKSHSDSPKPMQNLKAKKTTHKYTCIVKYKIKYVYIYHSCYNCGNIYHLAGDCDANYYYK